MSSDHFVVNHLRNLPMFERLSPQQLGLLANAFQVIRYEPGQLAFQQGQPMRGMIVFVSGRAVLTRIGADGLEDRLGAVEAGQYVNERALYNEGVETASLRIVEQSVVLFLDRRRFLNIIAQNPEVRTNLRVTTAPDARQAQRKFFKGQREDETVLHIFRHHWWSFARHGWTAAVFAVLLWIVAALIGVQTPVFGLALGGLGIVLPGLIMLYLWFEWQNDYLVITDQRVVRIWRDVLRFENTINEIPLERIIEVNIEQPPADVFARLFNYGTIDIRTAGEAASLHLRTMHNTKNLQTLIFAQRDRYREGLAQRNRTHIREEIERALGSPVVSKAQQASAGGGVHRENRSGGIPFIRTRFENEAGEIYYRKDATVWLAHVFLPLLAILASVAVGFLSLVSPAFSLYGGNGLLAAFALFVVGGLWLYAADWDWRNDFMILSQQTISLVRRRPLWLQNEVERVRLAQVDNVISEVRGLLDSLLNRGEIRITLIGSNEQKAFGKLFDPQEVQAEISRRHAQLRAMTEEGDVQRQRQTIADYLAVYHETVSGTPSSPPFNAPVQPAPNFNTQNATPSYNPYNTPEERTEPTEPPPIRDAVRPPRVPRVRPPDDLPEW
jgi:hypothetical protein